jgi:hypothetical protein
MAGRGKEAPEAEGIRQMSGGDGEESARPQDPAPLGVRLLKALGIAFLVVAFFILLMLIHVCASYRG